MYKKNKKTIHYLNDKEKITVNVEILAEFGHLAIEQKLAKLKKRKDFDAGAQCQ